MSGQVPLVPVQLPVGNVGQEWKLAKGEINGGPGVLLVITGPYAVVGAMFTADAARKLADELRENAGGIQVAKDVPPIILPGSNGQPGA